MQFKAFFTALAVASCASAQGNGSLTSLVGSYNSLSMLNNLFNTYPGVAASIASANDVTFFAPNNEALKPHAAMLSNASAAEVSALLSYHAAMGRFYSTAFSTVPKFPATLLNDNAYDLVPGGQVVDLQLMSGDAVVTSGLKLKSTVVTPNLNYTGGVAHIVDRVLKIPPPPTTVLAAGNLTDMFGAVLATNITGLLDTTEFTTIFAPSNAAFRAIGSIAANATIPELRRILEYHVVPGHAIYSSEFVSGTLPTLIGPDLTVTVEGRALFVNGARVINTNILTSTGVLHVIDSVLNPANATAMPLNSTKPIPQFASASSASLPVAITSGLPSASSIFHPLVVTTESVLPSGNVSASSMPVSSGVVAVSSVAALASSSAAA